LNGLLEYADLHSEEVSETQNDRSQDERDISTSFIAEVWSEVANRKPVKLRRYAPEDGTVKVFEKGEGNDG
jgi:hypothetical protein